MEKLLMVWVTEKQLKGDTLTQGIICEKARAIYGDLLNQTPRTSTDEASEDSFKANRVWFDNFRKKTGIHSVVRHGEAASSEPEGEDTISTSERKEILGMWERVSQFVEKKHPEKVATSRASELYNDTCLAHFRSILQGRKKQTSLDSFFLIQRKRQRPVKRKAVTKFKHTVAFKLCQEKKLPLDCVRRRNPPLKQSDEWCTVTECIVPN
ncbi:hypothetical protein AVEN_150089-1 [Araneus ventricosus]|uniref:HTH CENPB-type domain-containing protein n=1 Tax=Araneus ventricosus TaxID=182803 RepID=A0A4Y2DE35_ARAVE|nr:hypothetical protein AVEN_150089-1 [Araneus ventricosus]